MNKHIKKQIINLGHNNPPEVFRIEFTNTDIDKLIWDFIPRFIFLTYLFKPPATKFQTAVKAKKLNHQPVAGKINPSIITCSTTPAIMYCFKVIYYPFYKALMPYEFNIVARKGNLMCNQIVNFGQIND